MKEIAKHEPWCKHGICACASQGSTFPESTIRQRIASDLSTTWERDAWGSLLSERRHTDRVLEQALSGMPNGSVEKWWIEQALSSIRRYRQEEPRTVAPAHTGKEPS